MTTVDGKCSIPKIGNKVKLKRIDDTNTEILFDQRFSFELDTPAVDDTFSLHLPGSQTEGKILKVEKGDNNQLMLSISGIVTGGYRSIKKGNPLAKIFIPANGQITAVIDQRSPEDNIFTYEEYEALIHRG